MRLALLVLHSLRVCSDPNNLPFSDQAGAGFENRIAELLAKDLGVQVEYVWWAQRKNFVEKSLNAGMCDVLMGLSAMYPGVLETKPYYRSSYVFVYRKNAGMRLQGLSDSALANLRIGMHIVDANLAPPSIELARRGIVRNVKGYSLFGAYGESHPASKIVDAVRSGEIDVAIVWGPLGGYFGRDLQVQPIPDSQFTYPIAVAVRAKDVALRDQLQSALDRHRDEIRRILASYGVPHA